MCEKESNRSSFVYDAFGRCLEIKDRSGTQTLLYQGNQEIGSVRDGKLQEFRLVHPDDRYDITFATEINGETFFPIQDLRRNICALQRADGSLAEWTRYSVFGSKEVKNDLKDILNPWRLANRREVADLSLFTHRFYNNRSMRWQTTDPLGFEDGLNLYCYVHNNPFCYKDPDGRFAFAIPFIVRAFGAEGVVIFGMTIEAIIGTTIGTTVGLAVYEGLKWADNTYNQVGKEAGQTQEEVDKGKRKGKDNEIQGGPPRDPCNPNYLPDPTAEGPHTTLGIQQGRKGSYIQGATFDEKGEFKGRTDVTDVTDHGRGDHPNPHYPPASGPNSAKSPARTIPDFF
ncbi:MAG: RHS repeat domain-containing protein [Parachlamydiaceae bacterium]